MARSRTRNARRRTAAPESRPHAPVSGPEPEVSALYAAARAFIGFSAEDSRLLAAFFPIVRPHIPEIVDDFYRRIQADPRTARVITGGAEQIGRLKKTLRDWLARLLRGPHDDEFARIQARIGRSHVRVGLDEAYMVTGAYVFREHLSRILFEEFPRRSRDSVATQRAFVRAIDLSLALMLATYREDFLKKIFQTEQHARTRRLAALGEVAASIAHEIRNPLAGISGAIQVLKLECPQEDPHQKVLDEILREVDRLDERVNDLLLYARPSLPARELVQPRDLLGTTVRLLAEDPMLEHVKVSIHAPADLPPFPLDPGLVQQVLVNLLLNAVQAMKGRGEIRIEAAGAEGGGLLIAVEDTGPGIPPDMAETIFRPFFTTRERGTGLGLAISRKIVESHGGYIDVVPGADGGARFFFVLPPPESDPQPRADVR